MQYLSLLKGINVGGNNIVKMADLRAALQTAGATDTRTYIQSGNVLFESPDKRSAQALMQTVLKSDFGLNISVVTLEQSQIDETLANCPAPQDDPKQVHFFFANDPIDFDGDAAKGFATNDEQVWAMDHAICLYTPNGFSRSKLAERLPRLCKHSITGRNLNTLRKVHALF